MTSFFFYIQTRIGQKCYICLLHIKIVLLVGITKFNCVLFLSYFCSDYILEWFGSMSTKQMRINIDVLEVKFMDLK